MEDNVRKRIYTYMCVYTHTHSHIYDWITLVQQKLTEHCKATITEKKKSCKKILKRKKEIKEKKKKTKSKEKQLIDC